MNVTPRNRYFTAPPDQHSQTFVRGWSNDATSTGVNGGLTTGLWMPLALDQSGRMQVAIDNVSFSGDISVVDSGVFTSTTSIITGSQLVVAAGFKSASVGIISGYAYINGVGPIGDGVSLNYGNGYGGGYLSTIPLVVGTTGSASVPSQVVIISEF